MSWFAHAVACSLYALGFGAYFDHVLAEIGVTLPQWGFLGPQKILAVSIAIVFAYINFRGASETGKVGNMVTMAKIVILMIFVAFGIEMIIQKGNILASFKPFMPHGMGGMFKAMGLTFIAFEGYEVIAQSSEEIKNPRKNIPRAVFLSLIIVVPIYLLIAVTAIGAVQPGNMTPWDYLALKKEIALVDVARGFFWGGGVMLLIGGLISTMSALNATIYSSSRVAFAMGRDRNFPTFFSKVHKSNFTPHWAIMVSLVIVVFMAVSLPIEDVASAADIMFLLLFLQVNLAMIRLRKKRPDLDRGFITPMFPYLSILGIALLLFLAIYMWDYSLTAWIVTAVWVALGLVIYRSYAYKREIEHIQRVKSLERIEKKDYSILVGISNPESASSLTDIASAIAQIHNGEIIFLSVLEVHEGQPLMAGLEETARAKPILEHAEVTAEQRNIPARSIIKVAHRVSLGIVDTAIEENCNFIIIGRQKRPDFLDRVFSSLIDNVLQKAPSELAILHGVLKPDKVHKIVIPFGTNIHSRLAAEIAPALLKYFKAKLCVAMVVDPHTSEAIKRQRLDDLKTTLEENSIEAELRVVDDRDILRGVLRASWDADLVLMGGRSGDFLELMLGKSLTQEITEQLQCPVLWVKEYEERASFWSSLLKPYKRTGDQDG
jgi:basic amino acid/polyamine antiporter, APA family